MKQALRIANVSGIAIAVHWTFPLLLVWVALSNLQAGAEGIAWSILFVLALFVCVTLHELGHALTAKRYGIETKGITLYPIGGVAQLERMPEKPSQEMIVALAGPAVNFVIAGILYLSLYIGGFEPQLSALTGMNAHSFLPLLLIANLSLGLFNLLPAFPMDGGRVLRALLSTVMNRDRATHIAMRVGQVMAVLLVVLGFYANPFLIFIGVFIFLAGRGEAAYVHARETLSGYYARDAVIHHFHAIEADRTLGEAVRLLLDVQGGDLVITENGKIAGTLTRNEMIKALGEKGEMTPVREIMDREVHAVPHDMPLGEVYEELNRNRRPLLPVTENGKLLGIIDLENILEFLMVEDARRQRRSSPTL